MSPQAPRHGFLANKIDVVLKSHSRRSIDARAWDILLRLSARGGLFLLTKRVKTKHSTGAILLREHSEQGVSELNTFCGPQGTMFAAWPSPRLEPVTAQLMPIIGIRDRDGTLRTHFPSSAERLLKTERHLG